MKINGKILKIASLSTIVLLAMTTKAFADFSLGSISEEIIKTAGFIGLVALLFTFVPFASASSVLGTLLNWLLSIFTFIAVISFIVSGAMFILSGSDPTLRERAKSGLVYSIIGIAVTLSGWIILNTIVGIMGGTI